MSGMLERIARALCEMEIDSGPNLLTGVPRWHAYIPAARAAVAAMREPTEEVIDSGRVVTVPKGTFPVIDAHSGYEMQSISGPVENYYRWQKMIDEILKEKAE